MTRHARNVATVYWPGLVNLVCIGIRLTSHAVVVFRRARIARATVAQGTPTASTLSSRAQCCVHLNGTVVANQTREDWSSAAPPPILTFPHTGGGRQQG